MTNDTNNLSQQEWITIFTLIDKMNAYGSSKPAFYEKFINAGLKYNYFSPELKQKISDFHDKNQTKNYKAICEEWSRTFDKDFNIKEHFNIFLLSQNYDDEKNIFNFIENKVGKKETFYTVNRFFLDDDNASKYYILRKNWRELLEKYTYPINSDIVKRVVNDATLNSVSKSSNTAELVLNFKMLVLGHHYNPDIKKLEDYIVKYSKDALFEKRAFEYLEKKNINLTISTSLIDKIPFIKKEELIYNVKLNPEYLLKKHSLTRKNSEIICNGFIDYIFKKLNQPLSRNNSFNIELKCNDTNDYEYKREMISKEIIKLDKVVGFIKENKLSAEGLADFLTENIEKILMKEDLDTSLSQKPIQKKLKI